MPSMPTNAVAATPLLLLLLMLLLSAAPTQSLARTIKTTATPEPVVEEETTYSGNIDVNTVTVEADSDLILTTDDVMQFFTHFSENGLATTEEPLPESVLQQLERERAEREQHNKNPEATATEDPNLLERLMVHNLTTTTAAPTTTKRSTTTDRWTEDASMDQSAGLIGIDHMNHDHPIGLVDSRDYFQMEEDKFAAYMETTTFTPDMTTAGNNLASLIAESTSAPLAEMNLNTNDPISQELDLMGTESMRPEESTWMAVLSQDAESTTEQDAEAFMTTVQPEPELQMVTAKAVLSASNSTEKLVRLIDIVVPNPVTEAATSEPELQLNPTNEPNFMTTPQPELEPEAELITGKVAFSKANTTEMLMHLLEDASLNAATELIDNQPATELITTEEPPNSETTTTESSIVTTTETTIAAPKPYSMLLDIVMQKTTTTNAPETTTMLPETSTSTTTSTTTSTSSSTTSSSTTTSSTTTSTTTEPAPITTTETKPPATRAPRVERIFNPDGVEVLYGYSSVVRTNRL